MELEEQIMQLETKVNYLYDKFTRAAVNRSGSILNQMLEKKKQIKELKQ
jgi:hypothetical protein